MADQSAGQAAVGKTVDLRGVTVVGERTYGAQRFALVVLAATDERRYVDGTDQIRGPTLVSAEMEQGLKSFTSAVLKPKQQAKRLSDLMGGDAFDWEPGQPPKEKSLLIH